VISELHTNSVRAGFSLLVLSDDKLGIELGFCRNEIWAQEGGITSLFTHAEGAAFGTTTDLITYRLVVLGNIYNLSANGSSVLTGSLRNYTAATITFPFNPYTIPDLIFLGDDTSSARGKIKLPAVSIIDGPPYGIHLPLLMKD
jgi:hypothetical protein